MITANDIPALLNDVAVFLITILVLLIGLRLVFKAYIPWLKQRKAYQREINEIKSKVVHS